MSEPLFEKGYNDRLFNKSIRGKFHFARYHWIHNTLKKLNCNQDSVLELGCFDGRAIEYLPFKFNKYDGFDANWEGGLDLAKNKFKDDSRIHFHTCQRPEDFILKSNYDISLSMETLEHIHTGLLESYIEKIASHTNHYFLITVPHERGIFWLLKYLSKITIYEELEPYSVKDVLNTALGRIDKVERNECNHKGFDIYHLLEICKRYFIIEKIEYIPFRRLGKLFNMTVGIILKPKENFNSP